MTKASGVVRLEIVDAAGSVETVTFMNIWETSSRHSFAVRFGDHAGVEVDNSHGITVGCDGPFVDYDQKLSRRDRKSSVTPPFVVTQSDEIRAPSPSSGPVLDVEFHLPHHERAAIRTSRLSAGEHIRVVDNAGGFVAFNDQYLVTSPRYAVMDQYPYVEWFDLLQRRLARTGEFLDQLGVESGKDL